MDIKEKKEKQEKLKQALWTNLSEEDYKKVLDVVQLEWDIVWDYTYKRAWDKGVEYQKTKIQRALGIID